MKAITDGQFLQTNDLIKVIVEKGLKFLLSEEQNRFQM